ncbi:MAG: type I DNA topoisomerase [Candidatus Paceibacterota bacterium]
MNLIIVESPTKSKTLKGFLDEDYKIVASKGHIRDLPSSKLGIDIENNFEPNYVITSKKTVKKLKKEAKEADNIILGTDEDREGEAIAYHLAKALDLNKDQYKRIVFHEITQKAIENALDNPREIDQQLVNAQKARRVLDRIVGYKLSPFLWKKVARGLSAGRVQSVAVRLIVEREEEIEAFEPEEYWTIDAAFKQDFDAKLHKKDGEKLDKFFLESEKETQNLIEELKPADYQVKNIKKKEKKRYPYPPFTTSTLLRDAWAKFNFNSKYTMSLAQDLYESGHITYHRTDSTNLSQEALDQAQRLIRDKYGKKYHNRKQYTTEDEAAQQAHEAIRPTHTDKAPDQLDLKENQAKLYDLIRNRLLASQMSPAVFDSTTVIVNAEGDFSEADKYQFKARGKIMKFDGFTKVYPINTKLSKLPDLEEKQDLNLSELKPDQHFTQAPPRYTEAKLIKTLQKEGIGRPSTYATIISTIQDRNYVRMEKKKFHSTEIGTVVNNLLVKHFPRIVDLNFTAKMEEDLDEIAEGKKEWQKVIKEFYDPFLENLDKKYDEVSKEDIAEEETDKECPECGSPLIKKLGKFGRFYACSNFPECKYTEPLDKNKLNIECPECSKGELVQKRTKSGKVFYGCNQYPDCEFAVWDKPYTEEGEPQFCPECDSLLVETNSKIKCSNEDCDYTENKD